MAGIYIHIPFCRKNCSYCDFYFSLNKKHESAFFNALRTELALRKFEMLNERIDTIYFGGGTPSYANPEEISRIIKWIYSNLPVNPAAEITLEANPDDLTEKNLNAWKNSGINRLSIGVQSFDDRFLQLLNRSHNTRQIFYGLETARKTGFQNITIDLIYGIPGQTVKEWEEHIHNFLQLDLPHLSAYALTVEPGTLLAHQVNKGVVQMPGEEEFEEMFFILREKLLKAGYRHYEISNFACPGFESKHNKSYWEGKIYYGFGPSAHSYDGKRTRRLNWPNLHKYIRMIEEGSPWYETEFLSGNNLFNEFILTSLRTEQGLDERILANKFPGFRPVFLSVAQELIKENLLEKKGNFYRIPAQAKFLTDGIIERFIVPDEEE